MNEQGHTAGYASSKEATEDISAYLRLREKAEDIWKDLVWLLRGDCQEDYKLQLFGNRVEIPVSGGTKWLINIPIDFVLDDDWEFSGTFRSVSLFYRLTVWQDADGESHDAKEAFLPIEWLWLKGWKAIVALRLHDLYHETKIRVQEAERKKLAAKEAELQHEIKVHSEMVERYEKKLAALREGTKS